MKRVGRWLLNALTVLSLLLCVATAALWLRTAVATDYFGFFVRGSEGDRAVETMVLVRNFQGAMTIGSERRSTDRGTLARFDALRSPGGPFWARSAPSGITLGPSVRLRGVRNFGWARLSAVHADQDEAASFVIVPHWVAVLVFGAAPATWLAHWRRRRLVLHRVGRGDCVSCGYSLTANVSRVCPECGTAIVTGNE